MWWLDFSIIEVQPPRELWRCAMAMKELLFSVIPRVRLFLCVFLVLSALGGFRPVEGETQKANQENDGPLPIAGRGWKKQLRSLDDPSLTPSTHLSDLPSVGPTSKPTVGQKIMATIGFKSSVSPSTVEALPQGVVILYRYIYIDAIVVEMDTTLVNVLIQDDNIAYIEQDSLVYPMAESTPWGIRTIQANDVTVPAPDPSSPCFTICVVDSGFSVGHEDLVCNCTVPSRCLLSLHLTPPDFGIVAIFYRSWEYCWKRVWNPGGSDMGRAPPFCLSWDSCCWNDHCPGRKRQRCRWGHPFQPEDLYAHSPRF
jgi:hypothetical protein